jgi:hypothetical protein
MIKGRFGGYKKIQLDDQEKIKLKCIAYSIDKFLKKEKIVSPD